jgi:DNA adenine methylase
MILRRAGNKSKLADEIQKYFPAHKIYIEPFFGAGGMFFNKPKAKYNIVNDLDSDVFNLFHVVSNNKDELEQQFKMMPIHSDLLKYWNENRETEPIKKALRFLLLSNFTLFGNNKTLNNRAGNDSIILYENISKTHELLFGTQFANCDFRKFINSSSFRTYNDMDTAFIYCDPPYLGTWDNYKDSFTETDSSDLFDCLEKTGVKWAMSEFDHPFILQQAKERKLNVHIIGERRTLNNRQTEILVTNYLNAPTLFGWL